MKKALIGVIFLSGVTAGWLLSGSNEGVVKLGHTMHDCNGPGLSALAGEKRFWSITRFDSALEPGVLEIRISTAEGEQVSSWSTTTKVDQQDTVYFSKSTVKKVVKGRTGALRFGIYQGDERLAETRFTVE